MRRLIAGCGYLGSRVAQRWHARGDEVHVLTRSDAQARHFQQQGWHVWVGDVTCPETLPQLPAVDTVLWSVGFDPSAAQTVEGVKVDGLSHFLQRLPDDIGRFIYISSTGVYGQTDGSQVDETTECRPRRAGGRACLAAERLLLQSPWAHRTVILRLAGIYGPERLPLLKRLAAGEPLEVAHADLVNLIHVDDAAQVVQCAADRAMHLPRVFLVADGEPVWRVAFYEEVARLWETPPVQLSAVPSDGAGSHRAGGNKRVSNVRMQAELGVTLRYPSYREGLAAIRRETQ